MRKIILFVFMLLSYCVYSQSNDTIKLDGIEIIEQSPMKAIVTTPITYTNISKDMVESMNYNQDPSFILSNTPSITSYSDNGGGWGYTYYRLRGMDQTNINVTLNGVPMNEPEDQGCYFSNYVGVLNIVGSTQIQRGVGMNKNGVANFIGSVNFESFDYDKKDPIYFDIGIGSYNTYLYSFGITTKTKDNKLKSNISLNNTFTDGYRIHSGNSSTSLYFETTYETNKDKISFLAFDGKQSNDLAWVGSTLDSIRINNITNNKYYGHGMVENNIPLYFVQAPTNYVLSVRMNL